MARPNTNRKKAWQVMRAMGTFSATEVAIIAEVPFANIGHYMQCLVKAGYIRKEGKRIVPGRSGYDRIYRLVKNTGPKPPIQKALNFLYDPNTNKYWAEDPEVAAMMSAESTAATKTKMKRGKPIRLLVPRKKSEDGKHVA